MLSTSLVVLEELVRGAHLAYPEGGLLYTYTEAANQAHFRMPPASASALSSLERKAFSLFLQASQGNYTETEPSSAFVTAEYEDLLYTRVWQLSERAGWQILAGHSSRVQ